MQLAEQNTTRVDKELLAKIPAFPPVALRLQAMLATEQVSVPELVEVMRSDPALSAQLLRVANSPLFGFKSQVDSLHSAVVLLGLNRLQTLAVTIAMGNYVRATFQIEELRRCWRHTMASAMLAGELAKNFSIAADRAYTAGLLHDIGRLGLLVARPKDYAQILQEADRNAFGVLDLERKHFGFDHCEAGAWLAEHWGLPADIRMIAGRHHDTMADGERDLLALVHWSCRLADTLGFYAARPLQISTFEELKEPLRLNSPEEMEALRRLVEGRTGVHEQAFQASEPPKEEVADAEAYHENAATSPPASEVTHDLWLVVAMGLLFFAGFLVVLQLAR